MGVSIKINNVKKEISNKTDSPKLDWSSKKRFGDKSKESFYRELCLLLKSGVDFKKAMEILAGQASNDYEAKLLTNVKMKITNGKSIHESLRETGHFSPYEYYSIQIGEETRKLEDVLTELQNFFSRKIQMKRQLVSVFTYPFIVIAVTLLVLYFMLNNVVPMFSSVFRQFGSELPRSTQLILSLSKHSKILFLIMVLSISCVILGHRYFRENNSYRNFGAKLMLKIPIIGNLIRKIYLSRFCQSMTLLIASKTTLINALKLTERMVSFYPIETALKKIQIDIAKGSSLTEGMLKHDIFEKKMISMLEVAEQINQIDTMFSKLSEQYNEEISHKTKMIGVIVEPLIIVFIGIIVGVIMIAMYAPMFDLSKIIA